MLRSAHYLFRGAAHKNMLKTSAPMCRHDDQIDILLFSKQADPAHGRSDFNGCFKLHAAELRPPDEFAHLAFCILASDVL